MNPLLKDLEQRQILKQITDPLLSNHLSESPVTLYCGFDPTSDSLHVGSLLPLLTLRRFQLAGHRPIAVLGGATGMIGDPSGKSTERSLLTEDQIQKNLSGIRKVVEKFLDFSGSNAAHICNNGDWFSPITFIDFLRDVGKHFTVNHMMAKESVRARLEDREHGISFTEFSYMLLQAFDFYHLHKTRGCTLQIGGSDQWGNITAGIELIRRMHAAHSSSPSTESHVPAFGLTHPLVSKADGTKFGKSESGTVWLDPKRTSPYEFYQFFIQTADADVLTYLQYFTFLSHDELSALKNAVQTAPEKREAQRKLAQELTSLVHGKEEVTRAELAATALFSESIKTLDANTLQSVLGSAPVTKREKSALSGTPPYTLIDALVDSGLCTSKGAARKEIQGGGIYVNNVRATDGAAVLTQEHLLAGGWILLRRGKKTYHCLRFE